VPRILKLLHGCQALTAEVDHLEDRLAAADAGRDAAVAEGIAAAEDELAAAIDARDDSLARMCYLERCIAKLRYAPGYFRLST
jgi:hypothetical protein